VAERRQESTDGDHAVVQLVVDYVHCPQCDLTVPAFTGPEPLAIVLDGSMTRCGFCKWVFAPGQRMPLQVRHRCGDCGTMMRGPEGAAVLVCRACRTWFHNPQLDPAVRDRVEQILQEQHRFAAMIDQLLVATERMVPPDRPNRPAREDVAAQAGRSPYQIAPPAPMTWARPPASTPAPGATAPAGSAASPGHAATPIPPTAPPAPEHSPTPPRAPLGHRMPVPRPAPAGSNVRTLHPRRQPGRAGGPASMPMTAAFAAGLRRAARDMLPARQHRVLELRYGLDGRPGRTFPEIGAAIRCSPSRARALLGQALATIAALADSDGSREYLSCSVVVHLAAHAVGDPLDPQAPGRIRAFTDAALPRATPAAATDLLLRLAGLHDELAPTGQHRALRRAVSTARPS
jgi:hypothetical protein